MSCEKQTVANYEAVLGRGVLAESGLPLVSKSPMSVAGAQTQALCRLVCSANSGPEVAALGTGSGPDVMMHLA